MNHVIRNGLLTAVIFACLAASGGAAFAAKKTDNSAALAQLAAQLPGTLINDPTSLDWARQGDGMKAKTIVDANIPGGGAATDYDVLAPGPDPWSQQVYVPLTGDIAKGDVVTVGFWARAVATPADSISGTVGVRVQENVQPWPGFGDNKVEIGTEWKWHEVSATATVDVPKKAGVVVFQLGAAKQQIEIGQAIVIKGAASIAG